MLNNSKTAVEWSDVCQELYTPDEIAVSNRRYIMLNKMNLFGPTPKDANGGSDVGWNLPFEKPDLSKKPTIHFSDECGLSPFTPFALVCEVANLGAIYGGVLFYPTEIDFFLPEGRSIIVQYLGADDCATPCEALYHLLAAADIKCGTAADGAGRAGTIMMDMTTGAIPFVDACIETWGIEPTWEDQALVREFKDIFYRVLTFYPGNKWGESVRNF